jgi:cytochrome c553
MDGRGQKAGTPNLAAQPADYLVDALSAYRDGRRQHEPLQEMTSGMSDADIRNIAGYYAGLPPLSSTVVDPESGADASDYHEGSEVAAICAECHGDNGYSQEPGIPSLAGQQPAYLILSTLEYVNGSRGHAEKETMLKGLKQVDIEKMAMYFAAQVPAVRVPPPFGDPLRGEPLSAACGDCHGPRGISEDPLIPNLAGQEPIYLVNAIRSYRDKHRQHEDMVVESSDDEIEDIAAYFSVQQAAAAADDDSQAMRQLVAKCDRCHGPAAGKSRMVVPSLNGQNREYLVEVMKAYRDNDRGSSMMHKMSANYSDETIEALATYYANHAAE